MYNPNRLNLKEIIHCNKKITVFDEFLLFEKGIKIKIKINKNSKISLKVIQ